MTNEDALCNSITSLLRPQKAATKDTRLFIKKGTAVDDTKTILNRCVRNEFLPSLCSPTAVSGGSLSFTSDARLSRDRA